MWPLFSAMAKFFSEVKKMKRKITAILLLVCMLCSIVPINALVGASDNVGIFYTTEEKVYAVEENLIEDSISNDNISETDRKSVV